MMCVFAEAPVALSVALENNGGLGGDAACPTSVLAPLFFSVCSLILYSSRRCRCILVLAEAEKNGGAMPCYTMLSMLSEQGLTDAQGELGASQ